MWVNSRVFDFFGIAQDSFQSLKQEVAALKAERDALKSEVSASRIQSDWLRHKVNQLEIQNAALLEKAYDIRIPAPQIARAPEVDPLYDPRTSGGLFEDVGDEVAVKLGYPRYDS